MTPLPEGSPHVRKNVVLDPTAQQDLDWLRVRLQRPGGELPSSSEVVRWSLSHYRAEVREEDRQQALAAREARHDRG